MKFVATLPGLHQSQSEWRRRWLVPFILNFSKLFYRSRLTLPQNTSTQSKTTTMLISSVSTIANNLPPILPGIGGAVLTGLQVLVASTSFSQETNPETTSQYSKFAPQNKESSQTMIGSRDGMTRIYLPAFVVSSALYILPEFIDLSFLPQQTLAGQFVIVLFLKRLLEVYFLHRYSGIVSLNLSTGIGIYYALVSTLICSVAYPATNGVVTNVGTGKKAILLLFILVHSFNFAFTNSSLSLSPKLSLPLAWLEIFITTICSLTLEATRKRQTGKGNTSLPKVDSSTM